MTFYTTEEEIYEVILSLFDMSDFNINEFAVCEYVTTLSSLYKNINYFDYSEFSNIIEIGKGGFGVVNRATTKDRTQVALKGLINKKISEISENDIKNFVNEVRKNYIQYIINLKKKNQNF